MITADTQYSRDSADVRVHIKKLNLTLKYHAFDANDEINIFDCLTRMVNDANTEAQAFIDLQSFLAYPAETIFLPK